ncbi:MAG: metallophosphoesterase [Clostridium sp.]|nr:metallophosphoesterase [Clostridium sp.]
MKILLIADVHNKPRGSKKTLKNLEKAIRQSNCDLIVFLGDIVHGPDTPENYQMYLRQVLDLTGKIPFATVFGNHDDECDTEKEEILEVLKSYKNCLTDGRDYVLEMMGEILAFVDSGSYFDGDGSFYDTVKPAQIDFILNRIKGKKAILFQHIIVPDIMDLIDEYKHWVKGSVLDGRKFYKLKSSVQYSGRLGERPCPPAINTGELEVLAPHLKAMCFGHDHKNTFELTYKGVKLIQCGGSGSNSYDKLCRSTVKILDTKTLKTETVKL